MMSQRIFEAVVAIIVTGLASVFVGFLIRSVKREIKAGQTILENNIQTITNDISGMSIQITGFTKLFTERLDMVEDKVDCFGKRVDKIEDDINGRIDKDRYRGKKALVVDDNSLTLQMVVDYLELYWGFTVDAYEDFCSGMAAAMNNDYDIALIDYNISGQIGIDIIQAAQKCNKLIYKVNGARYKSKAIIYTASKEEGACTAPIGIPTAIIEKKNIVKDLYPCIKAIMENA
jgi:CheY-like chemotaxis protein